MLKKTIVVLLFLTPIFSTSKANPIDDKAPQFVCGAAPVSSITTNNQYIIRRNYAVHYRYDTKTPEYVVEHVTLASITGSSKRKDNFKPDPNIPKNTSAQLVDYSSDCGLYDRGHMSPAENNTQSDIIMSESFYLSNIIPQAANNNRGIWKASELLVRKMVMQGKDIYVISGTAYAQGYKKIGIDSVGVPTYIWKIIYDKKSNTSISFLFPNKSIPTSELKNKVVAIKTISELTKIKFKVNTSSYTLVNNLSNWK